MKLTKSLSLLFLCLLSSNSFSASRKNYIKITHDGGYFAAHKPEKITTDLDIVFEKIEEWNKSNIGRTIVQSNYDALFLEFLLEAIKAGLETDKIKQLRRLFNKGAIERLLEETDLEKGLVHLIGDVENDLIEKFREFIRKRIAMKVAELNETELGHKLDNLVDKIDNLPPFLKNKIELLLLKLLEHSQLLPESIKEKITEYAQQHSDLNKNDGSYWDTITTLGNYATAPLSYLTSLFS